MLNLKLQIQQTQLLIIFYCLILLHYTMRKQKISLRKLLMSIAVSSIFFASCSKEEATEDKASSSLKASTCELTLSSSTWTGKVDGTTISTGTDLFTVANACIAKMTSGGTVNLRASGNSGTSGGSVKSIKLINNITFNGNGYTITGNSGDDLIVPIYAKGRSNVAVKNLNIAGRVRYGIWFQGCSTMNIQVCNSTASCLCPAFRFDNATGSASNLTVGTVNTSGAASDDQAMGLETYGIAGVTINKVVATSMGGCGLLLNGNSGSQYVNTVTATSCDYGGGYAGFRCANSNGPVSVGTVTSKSCGRGFFSCTGSNGTTISLLYAYNCSSHGILMETCTNSKVLGGRIWNCGGDAGVRFSSTSSKNLIKGMDISGVAIGVRETSPGDYNTIQNCNVHGCGITLSGSHSVSTGNTL
jgi:hypothetical protein